MGSRVVRVRIVVQEGIRAGALLLLLLVVRVLLLLLRRMLKRGRVPGSVPVQASVSAAPITICVSSRCALVRHKPPSSSHPVLTSPEQLKGREKGR